MCLKTFLPTLDFILFMDLLVTQLGPPFALNGDAIISSRITADVKNLFMAFLSSLFTRLLSRGMILLHTLRVFIICFYNLFYLLGPPLPPFSYSGPYFSNGISIHIKIVPIGL